MARTEARLSVEIWMPESDFSELTSGAQWMYMFLLSQSDLAHSGVLPLRERRWSRAATDLTIEDIGQRLAELEKHRYVVVDLDTEEVLVRSFIRRDKVYRQPNVFHAALDHLPLIASGPIRRALAEELRRVQALEMTEGSATILRDMLKALGEPLSEPSDMPTSNPSENPSDKGSGMPTPGTPGERGVVTAVSRDSPFPVPRSPDTSASAEEIEPSGDADDPPDSTADGALFGEPAREPEPPPQPHTHPGKSWTAKQIDADPKWIAFWDAYPSSKDKGHARTTWLKWLKAGADPDVITAGAWAYRNDPGRDRNYTKHARTWLNGECWNDYEPKDTDPERPPGPPPFWEA